MNWDDPAERFAYIDRFGPAAYNAALEAHRAASTVLMVNDHRIRPIQTRFGRLFTVGSTGRAFSTLAQAKTFAQGEPS